MKERASRFSIDPRSGLNAVVERLGESVVGIVGDVTAVADNERAVATAVTAFGKLDIFVGNAGIFDYFADLMGSPADALGRAFDEVFAINVKGYLLGAKAAAPHLLKCDGCIILTALMASFYAGTGGIVYAASKHAVVGLVRQLAYELAPHVRVNGVAPGPMLTDVRGPQALGLDQQTLSAVPGIDELARGGVAIAVPGFTGGLHRTLRAARVAGQCPGDYRGGRQL